MSHRVSKPFYHAFSHFHRTTDLLNLNILPHIKAITSMEAEKQPFLGVGFDQGSSYEYPQETPPHRRMRYWIFSLLIHCFVLSVTLGSVYFFGSVGSVHKQAEASGLGPLLYCRSTILAMDVPAHNMYSSSQGCHSI